MDDARERATSARRRGRRSSGRGSAGARRHWLGVLLALVVVAAGIGIYEWVVGFRFGADESAVLAAKQNRDALLASTVPKAELWAEVERRGRAVKKSQETLAGIPPVEARIAAIEAELASLETRGAAIAERAQSFADQRTTAERELAAARAEVERLAAIGRGLGVERASEERSR